MGTRRNIRTFKVAWGHLRRRGDARAADRRSAHPSLGMGANRQRPTRAQKTRRGNEEDCAVWHREFEECNRFGGRTPMCPTDAGCRRRRGRARAECHAEPRVLPAPAAIHQRPRPVFFLLFTGAARWTAPFACASSDAVYSLQTYCMPLAGEGRGGGMWAPISSLALGKAQAGLVSRASVARPGT